MTTRVRYVGDNRKILEIYKDGVIAIRIAHYTIYYRPIIHPSIHPYSPPSIVMSDKQTQQPLDI